MDSSIDHELNTGSFRSQRPFLNKIEITDFRNIRSASVELSPHMNYVVGDNGAGKSSFLEAIYFGLNLKSFRARYAKQQIYRNAPSAMIRMDLMDDELESKTIGVRIDSCSEQSITCRLNSEPLRKISQLVNFFPSLYIDPECMSLIDGPPSVRRKFIDWGVFHVKPSYTQLFQDWKHSLRQRNSLLKLLAQGNTLDKKIAQELNVWTKHYIQYAEQVNDLRLSYFDEFNQFWEKENTNSPSLGLDIEMSFHRGWSNNVELASLLYPERSNELFAKTTEFGPHKADVRFRIASKSVDHPTNGMLARDYCSRGQKKLIGSTLRLMQGKHFNAVTQRPLILLVDDLGSELDASNRMVLLDIVHRIEGQKFFSYVGSDIQPSVDSPNKLFHVKQGVIQVFEQQVQVV